MMDRKQHLIELLDCAIDLAVDLNAQLKANQKIMENHVTVPINHGEQGRSSR